MSVAAIAVTGCKAKKQLVARNNTPVATSTTTSVDPVLAKLDAIKSKQVSFNTFSGRAKTKLSISGHTNDVTLNLHIQHNQKIWVSITAVLGIEVARALITPDSIQVINRLQGVYMKKPFSYIYKYTSPQLNYNSVEALLLGNAIPQLLQPGSVLEPTNNGNITVKGNMEGLIYSLLVGADLKVNQTSLSSQTGGQSVQVTNSAFIEANGRVIPSQVSIESIVKNNNIKADLNYNKTEFDQPLEYPFSIPDKFSPAN